jgi:hypothetical protein
VVAGSGGAAVGTGKRQGDRGEATGHSVKVHVGKCVKHGGKRWCRHAPA